jgi:hypothetical protein
MDDAEWRRWRDTNDKMGASMKAVSPCDDCTQAFATLMAAEGRCDGVPRGDDVQDDQQELTDG